MRLTKIVVASSFLLLTCSILVPAHQVVNHRGNLPGIQSAPQIADGMPIPPPPPPKGQAVAVVADGMPLPPPPPPKGDFVEGLSA